MVPDGQEGVNLGVLPISLTVFGRRRRLRAGAGAVSNRQQGHFVKLQETNKSLAGKVPGLQRTRYLAPCNTRLHQQAPNRQG
jgi:hypothetical protein